MEHEYSEWHNTVADVIDALRSFQPGGDTPPEVPQTMRELDAGGFWDHMGSDDLMAVLLRTHLWSEQALTEILKNTLPCPGELPRRMNFAQRVDFVASLGIIDSWHVQALRHMNKLRNKAAHKLAFELTTHDQANALGFLPGELREIYVKTPFPAGLVLALTTVAMWTCRL